ncbi:MAG TPA: EAL domain-containing protein [Sedimenticola sp.]|nr:EAL domain-containing protein [Sedimenticola sp.]
MKRFPQGLLSNTGFRDQLLLTFTLGIICLTLTTSLVTSMLSSRSVRTNIMEQGRQATQSFASQSTLALLYESAANARDAAATTLAFPDVQAVAIYDLDGRPLLVEGEENLLGAPSGRWPVELELEKETDDFWCFTAPVYSRQSAADEELFPYEEQPVEPELLGYVRVLIGKETLAAMTSDIMRGTFFVSGLLAAILLMLLLAITSRVTTPLKNLAEIMRRAEQGDKTLRAEVGGPRDIVHMETAFNTMMDVLEAREKELEAARDTALEAARVKGEFAANVSHELRTPLNGILGMLELLSDMDLTPKQLEYAKVAHDSGKALLELIDDVLDFSRAKAGKLKSSPVDFYLHEIMEDVVGLLSGQAARKGLELDYHIDENTPATLRGEANIIRQLLLNLAGNAVKYTEQGSIELNARITQAEQGMLLHLEVKDTGIGIPKEAQSRIFEAFSQVDSSTTRRYGGTGLGLAICSQLVDALGGEIGVESELGQGSSFWVNAPVEPAKGIPVSTRQRAADFAGLRILVVNSDETEGRAVQQALDAQEISNTYTAGGAQAIEELHRGISGQAPYRIAVVDEQLADMKGMEFLRRVLNDPVISDTRVVMASSRVFGRNEAQLAGIAGCVVKPIEDGVLLDVIGGIVSASGQDAGPITSAGQQDSTASLLGLMVLVAEDNRANQKVAVGMLERLGCQVDVVFSGKEAVEQITQNAYEVVLMDCHMPEMDGYAATAHIRAMEGAVAQIPIIAMTANTRPGDAEKCLDAGMSDYLPKPLKLKSLREKLLRWLPAAASPAAAGPPAVAEAPPQAYSEDVVDKAVLAELRHTIGQSIDEVIEAFLEDMPGYLDSLEKGIGDNDPQLVSEFAHTIKGSCRNLGVNKMAELGMRLEELGRSGSLEGAPMLLDQLGGMWEHVRQVLEHERTVEIELSKQCADEAWQPRILIADDDRSVRFALHNVLKEDGYSIDEVSNGAQAVAFCERQMPDLILLDAVMPVMDGFRTCSCIRRLPDGQNTPILVITSLDDEQSIGRAFAAGAVDYIPKPIHFSVLRQRVSRLLHASKAEDHIRRLAYHDTLTGLANRAHFNGRLEELLSRPGSDAGMVAVLFLDLDRFKLVNDTLGHDVGDLLLKAVAERIQGSVRSGDLVARLGGDEFTIILERVDSSEMVARVADKICRILSAPFVFSGQEIYVTTSIGISLSPMGAKDVQTIIKHADAAMFRAKEQGGGYFFYKEGMEAAATQILELETEVRQALERNELTLYYQPQSHLVTGEIVGAEALIRWDHPERGLVCPGDFIPQAEETGLIISIGEWVVQEASRQIVEWQNNGYAVPRISVNLSGRHLGAKGIVENVAGILRDAGVGPGLLELEITESAIMRQGEETISVLQNLKAMSLNIAIDDFGIGYSSLNYLKRFPIDRLKIDRSFVRDITADPKDAAIISAIIALARSLQIEVVAEGVETEAQQAFLRDQGCDVMQGYYVAKPMPAGEFEKRYLRKAAKIELVGLKN